MAAVHPGYMPNPFDAVPNIPGNYEGAPLLPGAQRQSWTHVDKQAPPGVPHYLESHVDPLREGQAPQFQQGRHPLDPTPNVKRMVVKLPKPRHHGGPQFWDNIRDRDAVPGWTEICSTPYPEASLAPVPQVAEKSWYNSWLYVNEKRSHLERHYLERFVQGADGEWIDSVRAHRMSQFIEDHRREAEIERQQRYEVEHSKGVKLTGYVDSYSGEHLVNYRGELVTMDALREMYKVHRSAHQDMVESATEGWSFDNLRIPWLFGKAERNKMISQNAYEWLDRRNEYLKTDRDFEWLELPSMYVDKEMYGKWRVTGGTGPTDVMGDASLRATHLDDYPYKL